MSYDNTNTGALFRVKDKKSEKHPDYNGSLEAKCPNCNQVTPFWLSAWLKISGAKAKNPGEKFFSLAINPKEERVGGKSISSGRPAEDHDDGFDDIPF